MLKIQTVRTIYVYFLFQQKMDLNDFSNQMDYIKKTELKGAYLLDVFLLGGQKHYQVNANVAWCRVNV